MSKGEQERERKRERERERERESKRERGREKERKTEREYKRERKRGESQRAKEQAKDGETDRALEKSGRDNERELRTVTDIDVGSPLESTSHATVTSSLNRQLALLSLPDPSLFTNSLLSLCSVETHD